MIKEPTITDRGELKKPDILFHRDGIVKVLDVTVIYKKENYLAHAARVQKEKYEETSEILRRQLDGKKAEVLPIVIGSRGAIPKDSGQALKSIGIGIKDTLTMSLMTLCSTIELGHTFLDYLNEAG